MNRVLNHGRPTGGGSTSLVTKVSPTSNSALSSPIPHGAYLGQTTIKHASSLMSHNIVLDAGITPSLNKKNM